MVKTIISSHARRNKDLLAKIMNIFGRALILRRVTETFDNFGQVSSISTSDVSFRGDLQFGFDLDQKYISSGLIEVGDGVLYLHPDELSTLPALQDRIVDGSNIWEVCDVVEAPELDGVKCHYSFRLKRMINSSDF